MAALQVGDEGGLDRNHRRRRTDGEREFKWGSLDAVDPFVLLLCGRGGDSVKSVVSLDDAAVCLRLAGLDHLIFVVRDEELEAVLAREENKQDESDLCLQELSEKCKKK